MMQEFSDPSVDVSEQQLQKTPTVKISDDDDRGGRSSCMRLCGVGVGLGNVIGNFFWKSSDQTALRYESNAYDEISPAVGNKYMTSVTNHVPLSLPKAHSDSVSCVYPVSKGLCLSGSNDMSVVLYNYEVGGVECKWRGGGGGHSKGVTACCYDPTNIKYYSASRDTTILQWGAAAAAAASADQPQPQHRYTAHTLLVSAIQLNQDGSQLLSGSRDNTVRLWDTNTAQCVKYLNISRNLVTDLKWRPSDHMILQTSEDKQVRVWDSRSLSVVHSFGGKQYIQTSCDVSGDGRYGVTASNGFMLGQGCDVTLWDLRGQRMLHQYLGHEQSVNACGFMCGAPLSSPTSPPSQLIITAGNDSTVRVWTQGKTECISQTYLVGAGPLNDIACFDDNSICMGSFNLGVHVLQYNADQEILIHRAMY